MTDFLNDLALQRPCPYCSAGVDEWCTTKSGALASWLHNDRVAALNSAWATGVHEGHQNALTWAAEELEKRRQGDRWTLRALVPLVDLAVIAWLRDRAARWAR